MSFAAMAAAADAAVFSTFSEHTAVLADGTPAGKSVACVFDGAYRRLDVVLGVESYSPAVTVVKAEVAGLDGQGSAVTVRDRAGNLVGSYTIAERQPERPDSLGLTTLILTEA